MGRHTGHVVRRERLSGLAQLLSSRGRVRRRSISTKWVRLKGQIRRFETSSICPNRKALVLYGRRDVHSGAFGQASTNHRLLWRFLRRAICNEEEKMMLHSSDYETNHDSLGAHRAVADSCL